MYISCIIKWSYFFLPYIIKRICNFLPVHNKLYIFQQCPQHSYRKQTNVWKLIQLLCLLFELPYLLKNYLNILKVSFNLKSLAFIFLYTGRYHIILVPVMYSPVRNSTYVVFGSGFETGRLYFLYCWDCGITYDVIYLGIHTLMYLKKINLKRIKGIQNKNSELWLKYKSGLYIYVCTIKFPKVRDAFCILISNF